MHCAHSYEFYLCTWEYKATYSVSLGVTWDILRAMPPFPTNNSDLLFLAAARSKIYVSMHVASYLRFSLRDVRVLWLTLETVLDVLGCVLDPSTEDVVNGGVCCCASCSRGKKKETKVEIQGETRRQSVG